MCDDWNELNRMLRKLKRTVAVTCLLATACFVILWMRSLKQGDNVSYVRTSVSIWEVNSGGGTLELRVTPSFNNRNHGFFFMSNEVGKFGPYPFFASPEWHLQNWSPSIVIPYWLIVAATGFTGFALLLRRPIRISLRTLAIAATLVVLTLGLGVAASRLTLG
jgi:hypothetical protein